MIRRLGAMVTLLALAGAACSSTPEAEPAPQCVAEPPTEPDTQYVLSEDQGPPAPAQLLSTTGEPVPFGQWWSSALIGPGTERIWAHPIAAAIAPDGSVSFSAEGRQINDDGTWITPFDPQVVLDAADGPIGVTDWGSFHVELAAGTDRTVTLMQGSLVAEVETSGPVTFRVPGVAAREPSDRVLSLQVGDRMWHFGADQAVTWEVSGESVRVVPANPDATLRLAFGPAVAGPGAGEGEGRTDAIVRAAEHPILATTESLEVKENGEVEQVLRIDRADDVASELVLFRHQIEAVRDQAVDAAAVVGTAYGDLPLVDTSELRLHYAAPPLLWGATPHRSTGWTASLVGAADTVPEGGAGSYFAGKSVHAWAVVAELAGAAGDASLRDDSLEQVRTRLDGLLGSAEPTVAVDPRWGATVLMPAEFGSGTELNDHHLQYGYWVGAAAELATEDAEWATAAADVIDALIADYGGASPRCSSPTRPVTRVWNSYEGHSWASGLARFADGNNLESTSEATFAWWAAAKWFLATGRPDQAEPFIARYTIETELARSEWLRVDPDAPSTARPWYGIRWSAKADLVTWFDPRPAAALGIQLLPVGAQSLGRYPDARSVDDAAARWAWCAANDDACSGLWPNLLATDAVVARGADPQVAGPELEGPPEESTLPAMTAWWSELWTTSRPSEWRCTAGAVARTAGEETIVMLTNPSPDPLAVECQLAGETVFRTELPSRSRSFDIVS